MTEARRLFSRGVGLTDAQLIASIFLNPPTLLRTMDKPLRRVAGVLGIHTALTGDDNGSPRAFAWWSPGALISLSVK